MKNEVAEYFDKNADHFLKLRKQVHRHPDEENVHDLRIATRRLLTLIKIFNLDPFSEPLKKAAKKLGKLRDLDVAIDHAKAYGLETEDLKEERRAHRKKIKNFFTKEHKKLIEKIIHHSQITLTNKDDHDLEKTLDDFREQMNQWGNVQLGRENFHEFRIALKKARYLLEAQGKNVKELKKLQDVLGDIHDLEVLTLKKGETNREIQKMKLEEFSEAVKLKTRLEKKEFLLQ